MASGSVIFSLVCCFHSETCVTDEVISLSCDNQRKFTEQHRGHNSCNNTEMFLNVLACGLRRVAYVATQTNPSGMNKHPQGTLASCSGAFLGISAWMFGSIRWVSGGGWGWCSEGVLAVGSVSTLEGKTRVWSLADWSRLAVDRCSLCLRVRD